MPSHSDTPGPRRDRVWQGASWAGLATLGMAAYLIAGGRSVALAWHLYLSALAVVGAGTLAGLALARLPSADPPSLLGRLRRRRRRRPSRLRVLEEIEHAVDFSQATAFDVHFRLRPHLLMVAEHRLAIRGVSLHNQPDAARRLLGDDAWGLLRPDAEVPVDRNARGLELARIRRIVDALEAI